MNKGIIAAVSAVIMTFSSAVNTTENADTIKVGGNTYELTFSDDFDGTELDLTKWSYAPEQQRQDAGDWWDDSMTSLDGNGYVHFAVSKDEDGRTISGAIRSKDKFEQAYGYYEIRCTLPQIKGAWCAFWLMGDSVMGIGSGGRDGTEIDIMESPYYPQDAINQTLNWDGYGVHHKSAGKKVSFPGVYDGFHTFGLEWTEDMYIYYIDGKETWRSKGGGICENPLYLKVSVETGTWAGELDESALPKDMVVDYVRVYKKV